MINSRSDPFKAFAGPYISKCEEIVYSYFPEFIKHTPVSQRPEKILALKKAGRRYFATDFTAFESHFVPEVMACCENVLFAHLLQNWEFADLICRTNAGRNKMRTRSGVSATCKGRRMSGDLWTSLGNGFTNLMLARFIVSEKRGTLEGFVEGDDGIFSTDVSITKEDYENLGFTIKIEEVDDPTTASFCGLVFAGSGEIIRDPRRFIQSFGWTQSFISGGEMVMKSLLLAKSLSSVYEAPQCPIVGAVARRGIIEAGNVVPLFETDGYHDALPDFDVPAFSPSDDTRVLFFAKYGIPPEVQVDLERDIMRGELESFSKVVAPHRDLLEFSTKALFVA
jgi:hypothetical protein